MNGGVRVRYINSVDNDAVCIIDYISMNSDGYVDFQEANTKMIGRSTTKISKENYNAILISFLANDSIDLTREITVKIVWDWERNDRWNE